MIEQNQANDLEISGPWAWGLTGCFLVAGAVMVASAQGEAAIQTLMYCSLIGVFMCCGIFVGLLSSQAIGAYFRWGETESNNAKPSVVKKQGSQEDDDASQIVDPFYEILKRNAGNKRAA